MSQSREAELLAKHQAELAVRDERLAALEKENELLAAEDRFAGAQALRREKRAA